MGKPDTSQSLLKNLFLYGVIGCISAGLDTAIFYVLNYVCHIPWEIANCISVPCGILVSFTLNRRYNFKVLDHPVRRGVIFFAVGLCGLILSQLLLLAGSYLGMQMIVAKLISIVIVALFQFTLNKLISFGLHFEEEK